MGLVRELGELENVQGALFEVAPERDLGAQVVRLAKDSLRGALVVPETRRGRQALQLGEPGLLGV